MSIRNDALPELTAALQTLARLAAAQGIRFTTADFGGFRTEGDTTLILQYRDDDYNVYVSQMRAAGKTPVAEAQWRPIAPYGRSYHDFGAARDLTITSKPSTMTSTQALAVVGGLAPQAGLRWGNSFGDPAHFELPISLSDAAARWDAYTSGGGSSSDGTDDASQDDGTDDTPSDGSSGTPIAFGIIALLGLALGIARARGHVA